jgi:hypothetical protein
MAGYSGTPLVQKLGIKPGFRVFVAGAPGDYRRLVGALPENVTITSRLSGGTVDMVPYSQPKRRRSRASSPAIVMRSLPTG